MATSHDTVTLFHSPNTRSSGALLLLEELGAPYELHVLDMKAGEQRRAEYLAINPLGKVPAILHRGALVTEQAAIVIYLADAFPRAGLAPAIGDPLRGPYLRWLVYYGSCFEPAVVDRSLEREPAPLARSPYGDYDVVIGALAEQLRRGPFLLDERFTAADVLWGMALTWTIRFGIVPALPEFLAYTARLSERPALAKIRAIDVDLAARHGRAASAAG